MKTKNTFFLKSLLLLFIALIFAVSGCKDNIVAPKVGGELCGSITYVNGAGKTVGSSGIKIYLINTNLKPDTVNYRNNFKAVLDSKVTDSSGNYKFINLQTGNYGVVPISSGFYTVISYDSSSPDSYSFSVTGVKRLFTVNFKTIDPTLGQNGTPFSIEIRFKNFPALEINWHFLYSIRRVNYYFFFFRL